MIALKTLLLAGAALVGGASLSSASAAVILFGALTPGTGASAVGGGLIASTSTGIFEQKTVAGVTAVGVSGGTVGGEIDSNETISFSGGSLANGLNGFTIAFLFQSGNQGDQGNEVSLLDLIGSLVTTLSLNANSTLSGQGTAGATVTVLSAPTDGAAGQFRVSGLHMPFTSLVFRSGNSGGNNTFGDFAFVDLIYSPTAVPEPASLALLGAGLLGLGMFRRRRA